MTIWGMAERGQGIDFGPAPMHTGAADNRFSNDL